MTDLLRRFARDLAQTYRMTSYRKKPLDRKDWEAQLDHLANIRLTAMPAALHPRAKSIAKWLRAALADRNERVDPHELAARFFGVDPYFDDPQYEFIAKWRDRSVAYRLVDHQPSPDFVRRLTATRVATTPRQQKFQLVCILATADGVETYPWEPSRPTESPPMADTKMIDNPIPSTKPPLRAAGAPTRESPLTVPEAVPAAPTSRARPAPAPVTHPADTTEHAVNEDATAIIGTVAPGEVQMDRSGTTYVVGGTLYHSEIEHIAILKGAPVILQGRRENLPQSPVVRVYGRIRTASVGQTSTIAKTPTTTAYLDVTVELVREAYPTDSGTVIRPWTPKPMAGYRIRWPTNKDLDLLGYPARGLSLGRFQAGAAHLPFYLPADALFRSLFAVGGMGGGKTNFLSGIARGITNADPAIFENRTRPAVVIIDAEGKREYEDIGRDVPARLRTKVEEAGIGPHGARDFRYFTLGENDRTFLLSDLTPQTTSVFPATLPAKSERTWTDAAERWWKFQAQHGVQVRRADFVTAMAEAARRFAPNAGIRNAVLRAATDNCWDVFDMLDAKPLGVDDLLVPGRVSVVDVSGLEGTDRQRAGGLALLTLLDIAKTGPRQDPCPVVLIIDEATRLIPATQSGLSAKEYSDKMGNWLGQVLHRGRRARYGLLLATQYPDDVLPALRDQPQTKIAFALQPKYDRWMKAEFGPEAPTRLREAATVGLGYVTRVGRVGDDIGGAPHPPTAVQFPQVRD